MDRRERWAEPVEALRAALDGRQAEMWTALPGIVQSFDPAAMTVSVQPAVAGRISDEAGKAASVDLPILPDVPVVFPGAVLPSPSRWRRGTSALWCSPPAASTRGGSPAASASRWSPGCTTSRTASPLSACAASRTGCPPPCTRGTRSSAPTTGAITPGGAVTAVGPSSVTVRSGGSITLDAPRIVIKGLLSMQSQGGGATTATLAGSLNATGDVTASNISLNSHTHPGDSGGTTGGPQ